MCKNGQPQQRQKNNKLKFEKSYPKFEKSYPKLLTVSWRYAIMTMLYKFYISCLSAPALQSLAGEKGIRCKT